MKNISTLFLSLLLSHEAYAFPHGASSPLPLLDVVACQSSSDAAYATVKLRTAYAGNAFQMRVKHSGTYALQNIGFVGMLADYAAADTFAATADAGTPPELRFYDQCGNNNDSTFLDTSTKGAIWSPYTLGNTAIRTAEFDTLYNTVSASSKQELVLPTTMAFNMDAFSVVLIGRRGSSYPGQPDTYWEFKNTAPWFSAHYSYNDGEHIKQSTGSLSYGTLETGIGVYMDVVAASTSKIVTNETTTSKAKSTLGATSNNGGTIGNGQILTTYNGGQDIAAQIFFNRTLSASEQASVDSYGYGLIGNTPNIPTCIVVIGDSASQSAFTAYNQNPINQAVSNVATPINKPVRLFNTATSGNTAAAMLSNISFYTGTCANAGVTKKIAIVLAGANDMTGGATPAQALTSDEGIWTAMHNAGFKVVCGTYQNASSVNPTDLATFNNTIVSTYASNNCDALFNTWGNANVGAGSNNANTTYWYTDRIHLNANGNNIPGGLIAAAVNSVD